MATRIKKTDLARDALYNKVNTMIDEVNTKIDNKDSLPSQTGKAGKFLTTDGTNASWGEVKQIDIKQDLKNPSADTVPSTKAVSDESSRITTLMNTKITNCITEIPQDIKLELNNGTLTLKAGSKVYYNGLPVIIDSDKSLVVPTTFPTSSFIISVIPTKSELKQSEVKITSSSASNPGVNYAMWFNTTDNKCYINDGNANATMCSYPICIVNCVNGTGFTSIDQVFNGFGYIGSTVFALPGVKGLIPNGRNADGSLKSIEFTISSVLTRTFTSTIGAFTGYAAFQAIAPNFILSYDSLNYWTYNEEKNIFERQNETTGFCYISKITTDSTGKITSFTPKTVFHALDYNDKATIFGWNMPDYNSGITLTFNKVITHAGESKTMAKSGLFCFYFLVNNVISTIYFYVNNRFVGKIGNSKTSVAFWDEINFPVTKGDVVKVTAETVGGFTAAAVESYLFPYKGSMYE